MNHSHIFNTIGTWITGLVNLFAGLVALGVMTEILFGTAFFGTSVVANITTLVGSIGSAGFAGIVSLLILVAMFNNTMPGGKPRKK